MNIHRLLMMVAGPVLACSAQAAGLVPGGAFVAGAVAEHGGHNLTAGVVWPWGFLQPAGGGELTAQTEAFVSHWSVRGATDRMSFTQVGVVPIWRFRFRPVSPWFIEGGIGVSYLDRLYVTPNKVFSTRFNFYDVGGIGRSFGPQRQSEVSLRLIHISNAGIKRPNPGQEWVQLRYQRNF